MSAAVSLPRRLLQGWLAIAVRFGEVQTEVMLAIFYGLLIGPLAALSRLSRRDLLQKRALGGAPSAWNDAETGGTDLERAKLQS